MIDSSPANSGDLGLQHNASAAVVPSGMSADAGFFLAGPEFGVVNPKKMDHNNAGIDVSLKPRRKVQNLAALYGQLLAVPVPIAGYPISNPESSP